MMTVKELQNKYYNDLKGLPSSRPVVRNNQPDDAFEVVVLKVLYGNDLDFEFTGSNAEKIAKYVVPAPDGGIDIFFEKASGDDYFFDVIQVKNRELTESDIKACFVLMERVIDDYCKNPGLIDSVTCREMLSASSLEKSNKNNCRYFVVHTGSTQDFSGSRENEHIITLPQLEVLLNNNSDSVDSQVLSIDKDNNLVIYGEDNQEQKAIICSISGYDLAELNNKYYSTEKGRNILFGQNLREALNSKKSKTYQGMKSTIDHNPEKFWFFNNGITIIAEKVEEVDEEDSSKVTIKNFSIVNGAQTTSSLGLYLKEARNLRDNSAVENLKKVFVLTRILQVADEDMRRDIAIFNNTQNPITSRDMVANREEQKRLYARLMDDEYPQIYVEIRRGSQIPSTFNKGIVHRKTTNEELAQLAYAAFYQQPFVAKDKKSALFRPDYNNSEYTLNKIYHDVFNYDNEHPENNGILHRKSKLEIDEALFVQYLYKQCKLYLRRTFQARIEDQERKKEVETDPVIIERCNSRISEYASNLEMVGICMFYFISLYYEFRSQFSCGNKRFNVETFYEDKRFKENMIKDASELFLSLTIKLLKKTAKEANKSGNINNWVRGSACQEKFAAALDSELSTEMELEEKYNNFVAKYMTDIA